MKLWSLFACVAALYPVTDFRVKDMGKALGGTATSPVKDVLKSYLDDRQSAKSGRDASDALVSSNPLVIPLQTDIYQSIYWTELTVNQSTPQYLQTFLLLLDTGSAIAWIANASCLSAACARTPKFSTTTVTPTEFYLDYSSGKISGLLVDPIKSNITYSVAHQLSVDNFTCGLAASVPSFFPNYNVSGILGLSANASLDRGTNLVLQLGADSHINSSKFALVLGAPAGVNSNTSNSTGGLLFLGQAADTYKSILALSPVQSRPVIRNIAGYWMLKATLVSVLSSTGLNNTFQRPVTAVFDTGTTGLALPTVDADSVHQLLFGNLYVTDGSGNYAFPCNATGSVSLNIDGLYLSFSVDLIRADAYTSAGLQGMCSSKMQGLASTPNWILGAAFLKSYYTVFDIENQTIGFAPRVAQYSYDSKALSSTASSMSSASLQTKSVKSSTSSGLSSTRAVGNANLAMVNPWMAFVAFLGFIY